MSHYKKSPTHQMAKNGLFMSHTCWTFVCLENCLSDYLPIFKSDYCFFRVELFELFIYPGY